MPTEGFEAEENRAGCSFEGWTAKRARQKSGGLDKIVPDGNWKAYLRYFLGKAPHLHWAPPCLAIARAGSADSRPST